MSRLTSIRKGLKTGNGLKCHVSQTHRLHKRLNTDGLVHHLGLQLKALLGKNRTEHVGRGIGWSGGGTLRRPWKNCRCPCNAHTYAYTDGGTSSPREAGVRQRLDHLRKAWNSKGAQVQLGFGLLEALLCDVGFSQALLQDVARLVVGPNAIAPAVTTWGSSQYVFIFQKVQVNANSGQAGRLIDRQLYCGLNFWNIALKQSEKGWAGLGGGVN